MLSTFLLTLSLSQDSQEACVAPLADTEELLTTYAGEAEAFRNECGYPPEDFHACDVELQRQLEAAVANQLYSQCECVYYSEQVAFNYNTDANCFKAKINGVHGRCWRTSFKKYFVDGGLEQALKEICGDEQPEELPAPATTTTSTTPKPQQDTADHCKNDPNNLLQDFLYSTCEMQYRTTGCGGADADPEAAARVAMVLDFIEKESGEVDLTMASLCPRFCDDSCPKGDDDATGVDCTMDDPEGRLAAMGTDCLAFLADVSMWQGPDEDPCADPQGQAAFHFGGSTTSATLCPVTCNHQLREGDCA